MTAISPRVASELAELVYQIQAPDSFGNYRVAVSNLDARNFFEFDLSNGPVHGVSGGFLGLFQKTSGFALVGQGKGQFKGDHVIAVRGTKTGHDWLTNGNVGLSTGHGGASVHSGFNQTFESMRPAFERMFGPLLRGGGSGIVHCVGHSLAACRTCA